ncbi:SDR family oxidoreductase [Metabacillus arenae]|uniref:SDR family oxidoreductase n=1 Tax=Metabacillus arenae TaxID=2771434 RepID=A0A926NDA5_9BACI|nr:SDR family oxidoreductase [Metabacillus arenae]MBD1379030.1 SDR family oxidoreductase [Metabacillus arenae]
MTKTAIVTGGANGIGKEIVKLYAKKGYKVVFGDIDTREGLMLEEEMTNVNQSVHFVKCDVQREDEIIHLIKTAKDRFGSVDVLINNAGVSKWKSVYELTVEDWDDIIHTNLRSVFICSKEAAKLMRDNPQGGSIVNIASTRAIMSEPNSEAYAAAKGGITALTHALAASLSRDKITVNSVSPGWIETDNYSELRAIDHKQHFSQRVGKPIDIANACFYLTNPENDFINGVNLVIDGGMTRKMIYEA